MLWDLEYSNFLIAHNFGIWVSTHLSNFREILYLKHPALWFRGLRRGAYLWCDVCYRWMLNVSVNISSGRKWLYVICCTYRSLDAQCETTIPDSVSDQVYFNGILKNISKRDCRITKTISINSLSQRDVMRRHRYWSTVAQVSACSLTAPSHNLDKWYLEFVANLCSGFFSEILKNWQNCITKFYFLSLSSCLPGDNKSTKIRSQAETSRTSYHSTIAFYVSKPVWNFHRTSCKFTQWSENQKAVMEDRFSLGHHMQSKSYLKPSLSSL